MIPSGIVYLSGCLSISLSFISVEKNIIISLAYSITADNSSK